MAVQLGTSYRFEKRRRLRKRREFLFAQNHRHRRKIHGKHFLVIAAPRGPTTRTVGTDEGRIGITVSKKVGNAVVRNRIKRWVREFARHNPAWLPRGNDVVVIARRTAAQLTGLAGVSAELSALEKRLRPC